VTGAGQEAAGTPQPIGREPADVADPGAMRAFEATRFAHASEAEMARILDFYAVRWEYEPTTFPILWNLDGDVVESFAPDFYLPELGVFLEMTTLKQRLVRKKNRKLRRLRELYPDIRIKLFYARDFRAMMLKYGRLGLAESLSGTLGQVVPEPAATSAETIGDAAAAALLDVALDVVLAAEEPAEGAETLMDSIEGSPGRATRSRSRRRGRRAGAAETEIAKQAGAEREAGA
jgi:hypoxanthine phosphoribosyltransferase